MPKDSNLVSTEDLTAHFACPACRTPLELHSTTSAWCPRDGLPFARVAGIWRFLTPDRATYYDRFIREYEIIRRAEGRSSQEDLYYRALPFEDRSGRRVKDWRIRATSFRSFIRGSLQPIQNQLGRPLRILDLGAGNGWLSNRLASRGHAVAALDLAVNADDGLGAHTHYGVTFLPVQAEFDHVPFTDGLFDLAIYNASFHYSVEYSASLREAFRTVTPTGRVVILDTPIYHNPASGARMVADREASFRQMYGFPSDAIPSENYLTFSRLTSLGAELGVGWHVVRPFYGMRWAIRPWLARLRRHREPAAFLLLEARRAD